MLLRATLLAALGLLALPASAQTADDAAIATSTASQGFLNNGNLGGVDCDINANPSFIFSGTEEMCGAGFLVGFGDGDVVGDAYLNDATTEWTPDGTITPATVFPYAGFDMGFDMAYTNAEHTLSVAHSVFAGEANPDVILHQFDLTNTGTDAITGAYPGVFHDWDVGYRGTGTVYTQNVAVRNGSSVYVFDPTGVTPNVLGVSLLGQELSGWIFFIPYPSAAGLPQDESEMWTGLTTQDQPQNNGQDQRVVQGAGPYDIAAGETVRVLMAFAGGTSEDDFLQNIADTEALVVADEAGPRTVTDALSLPTPNPAAGAVRVTLSLDAAEAVRVTVTDVLGRTVATLHDGPLAAGDTPLTVEAGSLSAGVYAIRAEGETFRQVRTLTVAR